MPAPFGAELLAKCMTEGCTWQRVARFDLARVLQLAGFEHMREHEMHLVGLNFEPPAPQRTVLDLQL